MVGMSPALSEHKRFTAPAAVRSRLPAIALLRRAQIFVSADPLAAVLPRSSQPLLYSFPRRAEPGRCVARVLSAVRASK